MHTTCRKDCACFQKHNFLPVDSCTRCHAAMGTWPIMWKCFLWHSFVCFFTDASLQMISNWLLFVQLETCWKNHSGRLLRICPQGAFCDSPGESCFFGHALLMLRTALRFKFLEVTIGDLLKHSWNSKNSHEMCRLQLAVSKCSKPDLEIS